MFGNLADNTSINATIDDFAKAVETMATDPQSAAGRIDVVNAASATSRSLNSLADQVQTLRGQADQEIAAAIDDINAQLRIIADLNGKITSNRATGLVTGDLEDQRSEERRGGKEGVSTCRSRWSQYP